MKKNLGQFKREKPLEKTSVIGKAVNWVDQKLYSPIKRIPTSVALGWGSGIAGGAGAGGVLLGKGETFMQKVGDAVTAVPKGFVNLVKHYMNAPEYARQTNDALEYLKERGPEVASELNRSSVLLQNGARQAGRATDLLREGQDYLTPGGEKGFDLQNAYYAFKDGINQLESAVTSINAGKDQAQETAGPAIEALQNVDLNPVLQALHNLADNVSGDEIGQTIAIGASSVLAGYLGSQYLRGYWGRRGRPGIVSRAVQRSGLKRFRDYFVKDPEKIAGPIAVEIMGDYLVQNPQKLEELAERADCELRPKL